MSDWGMIFLTFAWHYSLLKNLPIVLFGIAASFCDLLFEFDWLQFVALATGLIVFSTFYYQIMMKSYYKRKPRNNPKNRTASISYTTLIVTILILELTVVWLAPAQEIGIISVWFLVILLFTEDGFTYVDGDIEKHRLNR
ncbi:hypothetical protein KBX59_12205 [Lentilactobacillus hilgardii]|nr:hypothetical protein [Lentilactobacillus hilgardii]MCP9350710.1 hypothetical protein [Lentilactobacillus hilgardii]MCP9353566.1 hypothetical protein [Lentilactobacillus hilgardii]